MAASKTKSAKKGSSAKKNTKDKEREEPQDFRQEIGLWALVAVALLLFISNFGVGGTVGEAVSRFVFGVFGLVAYVFPLLLIAGCFFSISNRGNSIATVKLISAGFVTVFLCCLLALILTDAGKLGPTDAFLQSFVNKSGGGIIGGTLAFALTTGFGTIGAYIITFIAMIIALVLFTGKSAIGGMKKGGTKVYHSAKERHTERTQERRQRRTDRKTEVFRLEEPQEERQVERRSDRKADGFAVANFTVGPADGSKETGELHELSADAAGQPKVTERSKATLRADEFVSKSPKNIDDSDVQEESVLRRGKRLLGDRSGVEELYPTEFTEPKITGYVARSVLPQEQDDSMPPASAKQEPVEQPTLRQPVMEADMSQESSQDQIDEIGRKLLLSLNETSESHQPASSLVSSEELPEVPEAEATVEESYVEEPSVEEPEALGTTTAKAGSVGRAVLAPEEKTVHAEPAEKAAEPAFPEIKAEPEPVREYVYPPIDLLAVPKNKGNGNSEAELRETAMKLQQTLKTFGVNVTVTDISCGPAVTRYEIQPEMGVKVSKIVNLADDIKLNLAAADIRIEAPIPGKPAVGIEVPNKENVMVSFRELIESREFQEAESKISFAVGRDIGGKVKVSDIAKMPHVLIAGATGSGKSVCINTIIMSILYKAKPDEVKLIMIDPKVVELSVYNGIPHLMIPVVTDPKKAAGALNWAVQEMTDRYNKFAETGVRKFEEYNAKIDRIEVPEGQERPAKMAKLVIIVDELADLMMVASHEVEDAICRLAQLARAAGIHLIIATQRPSVNVITGLIKANMPSRIAFAVTSGIDSRTILDMNGAEKLLGKGDMLFNPQGVPKPLRVQGAFVSDDEVSAVVEFLRENNGGAAYSSDIQQKMESMQSEDNTVAISDTEPDDGKDAYYDEAARIIVDKEKASIGMLQRYLKVGFNRAARIMDQLEEAGIVGPEEGTKPRKVLMTMEEFEQQNAS